MKQRNPSATNKVKDKIQQTVRKIVIERDGGCILRFSEEAGPCGGYKENGELILQADHLVTRANSATYADTRLIVCLCAYHHGTFKKNNLDKYNTIVRSLLPKQVVDLWRSHAVNIQKATRKFTADWFSDLRRLEGELVGANKRWKL